jgi:hypothetical protein
LLGAPLTVFLPDVPPFYAYMTPAHQLPDVSWALTPMRGAPIDPPVPPPPPKKRTLREALAATKAALGWKALTGPARTWWKKFAASQRRQPRRLLFLLRALERQLPLYRKLKPADGESLLSEYVQVHRGPGMCDLQMSLTYLRYSLLKRVGEVEKKA